MKSKTKKYVFGLAALAGLFVIGSLMRSPYSQAKGAFSSPVTVVNTTTGPGSVLDADTATRIPYQSLVIQSCGTGNFACGFLFTAAPSGFRLTVENVSGAFSVTGSFAPTAFLEDVSGNAFWNFTGALGNPAFGNSSGFNQIVRAYFDPADGQPRVIVEADFSAGNQSVILSGYLQNCAVVACPTIQR